ncbi:HAD-IA family hydrolase [Novosphingobium sp. PS1R-30]|uniref:HAD-IA family hydrolase n=1 Tax=Novosphingobium anseongense TaxID=3133436 RepID=A0ABU8S1V0_9SPHN
MWPELIVFDFDGVIADSELLACGVAAAYATELGKPMSTQEGLERFMGRQVTDVRLQIEQDIGRRVPDFVDELRRRTLNAFKSSLQPVNGAIEFLRQFETVAKCIASSSALDRIRASLEVLGVPESVFARIFSAEEVERGKPFPDIFLHAASSLDVGVDRVLVIEDSVGGVRAAAAAGMAVVGLVAGSHIGPKHGALLMEAGAEIVLASYRDVKAWLVENSGR